MDTKILIALITGGLGFLTALFSSIWSFRQTKIISRLQKELELKSERDSKVFNYLMGLETDAIDDSIKYLKEYLKLCQILKDELRYILHNENEFFEEDIKKRLDEMRKSIIEQYSNSVFRFNQVDNEHYAHTVKNLFLELIDKVRSNESLKGKEASILLNEISNSLIQLQETVEQRIKTKFKEIQNI